MVKTGLHQTMHIRSPAYAGLLYIGKIAHKGQLYEGQHAAILDNDIWEQVQALLAKNRVRRNTRQGSRHPSLLAGLLFDDEGNPMSPTHTSKGTRRYRYYISQAILKFRESEGGSVIRIAANVLEKTITEEVKRLLRSGHELLEKVVNRELSATKQKQLIARSSRLAETWDQQVPQEHIQILQKIIHKVVVGQSSIDIYVGRSALTNTLLPNESTQGNNNSDQADTYKASIPMQLKRCGIETRLIVQGLEHPVAHDSTVRAIQDSLKKALDWNQALITSKAASMADLARAEDVTQRYVAHIIKLAWLAPDIMEDIFKGNIPATLSLGILKKCIPLDWQEQRKRFGFS